MLLFITSVLAKFKALILATIIARTYGHFSSREIYSATARTYMAFFRKRGFKYFLVIANSELRIS
jgi:uncharacterized membrane protein YdjX (TVP38/TMEM64 family)